MGYGADGVIRALSEAADVVTAHRDELVELDRLIGDGDHGENLRLGFQTFVVAVQRSAPATPGAVVKLLATTLISAVGGVVGPLYETACLRAATALGDTDELTPATTAAALQAALQGVVARGRAEPGDKTMVDALVPAVAAALRAAEAGADIPAVLRAAADAAAEGAAATVPLVARKGRASYLGERTVGHLDPGARSTALLLRSFADSARRP